MVHFDRNVSTCEEVDYLAIYVLLTLLSIINITGVPGADKDGAGRIGWTGFSTLFFGLASMMFY